ncbi:MAG TPA: adenylate/guanylate cyclase domain-containing protein [Methylomirabilota bacterium]|nr:adenylate/guanylate cyclase domain-containing protein [Methylomirabilota bacterium]
MTDPAPARLALPAWRRLAVRLALAFAVLTFLSITIVGVLVRARQKAELEDAVGTQLLNIARVAVLLVDPAQHMEVQRAQGADTAAYQRMRARLASVQREVLLTTPIRTLTDFDRPGRRAKVVVSSEEAERPGGWYTLAPELIDPIAWSLEDGVARYTGAYRTGQGTWISAVAPIVDGQGKAFAILSVDYQVDVFLDRLHELDATIAQGSAAGAICALLLGLLFARGLTRPISALTGAVARVAGGDLSQSLPVRSRDEVGVLTRAFNEMVEGLRQRDFIRNAFGRYVSPEVARALLESPDGLRLGGEKREITVLMSDLRGYTRFAEHGDPAGVMAVLNDYLGHMADVVIAHGGTINEFIGDAIFAVFGAPVEHADHAERAAATALAMQRANDELNRANAARGRPTFEMGIGLNTGEAVVGNIGSEQRTKYAVVGAAVNLAARVEGCTVGGQILMTAATAERLRDLAEVAPPISVELKGLASPIPLYELRGLRGRFAQRLNDAGGDADVEIVLPVTGAIIEDKRVHADTFTGTVRRLGGRSFEAVVSVELAALTNVRLRLSYPDPARESGDVYGKVTGTVERDGRRLVRIHLTSVDAVDQAILAQLRESAAPRRTAPVSNSPEVER